MVAPLKHSNMAELPCEYSCSLCCSMILLVCEQVCYVIVAWLYRTGLHVNICVIYENIFPHCLGMVPSMKTPVMFRSIML